MARSRVYVVVILTATLSFVLSSLGGRFTSFRSYEAGYSFEWVSWAQWPGEFGWWIDWSSLALDMMVWFVTVLIPVALVVKFRLVRRIENGTSTQFDDEPKPYRAGSLS